MKDENLIHVKLEYDEIVQSKQDILIAEANFLKIIRTMKTYHPLRTEELKLKMKIHSKISEIISNIKKLELLLPQVKIPNIFKDKYSNEGENFVEIEEKIKKAKASNYDSNLEFQLQNINDKLRELANS